MKIAILSYRFLPALGGGETVLAALASRLSKEGHDVRVISNFQGPTPRGYSVYRTPRFSRESISRIAHLLVASTFLLLICLTRGIDIIQVAGLTDLLASFPAKMIFRPPVVLRLAAWWHPQLLKGLKKQVSLSTNTIIALTDNVKAQLLQEGFRENQIVVIPNGVDVNEFRPGSTNRREFIMLWVGRFDADKRPEMAIKTLSLVRNARTDVYLQMVGDGCIEDQLRDLVSQYGLQDSVAFLGRQTHDKIAETMRNADVFIAASKGEGMSNALLEAMACGMAVVATSASTSSIIANALNGFIADHPADMASIVSQLAGDLDLRHSIGRNARRTVMEEFSAERMFLAYSRLYEQLLRR